MKTTKLIVTGVITLFLLALVIVCSEKIQDSEQTEARNDRMVFVQGGTFSMGCISGQSNCHDDEKPTHKVTVDDFYIGKYEVTVAEFRAFIKATNYLTDADIGGGSFIWTGLEWKKVEGVNWQCDVVGKKRSSSEDKHPVIHVSWNDA